MDEGTVVEFGTRFAYFTIWSLVILLSLVCFVIGLYVLNRCRQGLIIDPKTARGLQMLGGMLVVAMVADMIFSAVDFWVITLQNSAGAESIAWNYDPSDVKSFLLGMTLFLFGWVMREAILVEQENRGFV